MKVNKLLFWCIFFFLSFCNFSLFGENTYEAVPNTQDSSVFRISEDEKILITANKTDIQIWDSSSFQLLSTIHAYTLNEDEWIEDIEITRDNKYIFSVNNGEIKKWDVDTGKKLAQVSIKGVKKILLYKNSIIIQTDLEIYKYGLNLDKFTTLVSFEFFTHVHIACSELMGNKFFIATNAGLQIYSFDHKKITSVYKNLWGRTIRFNDDLYLLASVSPKTEYGVNTLWYINLDNTNVEKKVQLYANSDSIEDIAISHDNEYFATCA